MADMLPIRLLLIVTMVSMVTALTSRERRLISGYRERSGSGPGCEGLSVGETPRGSTFYSLVEAGGMPNHPIYRTNQYGIKTKAYSFYVLNNPVRMPQPTCLPPNQPIAFAINGVPIYSPVSEAGANMVQGGGADDVDGCGGRVDSTGTYYYTTVPSLDCLYPTQQLLEKLVVGITLDGFLIYRLNSTAAKIAENEASLDVCRGKVEDGVYEYYASDSFPYTLGCFRGYVPQYLNRQPQHPQPAPCPVGAIKQGALCACQVPAQGNNNGRTATRAVFYNVSDVTIGDRRRGRHCWEELSRTTWCITNVTKPRECDSIDGPAPSYPTLDVGDREEGEHGRERNGDHRRENGNSDDDDDDDNDDNDDDDDNDREDNEDSNNIENNGEDPGGNENRNERRDGEGDEQRENGGQGERQDQGHDRADNNEEHREVPIPDRGLPGSRGGLFGQRPRPPGSRPDTFHPLPPSPPDQGSPSGRPFGEGAVRGPQGPSPAQQPCECDCSRCPNYTRRTDEETDAGIPRPPAPVSPGVPMPPSGRPRVIPRPPASPSQPAPPGQSRTMNSGAPSASTPGRAPGRPGPPNMSPSPPSQQPREDEDGRPGQSGQSGQPGQPGRGTQIPDRGSPGNGRQQPPRPPGDNRPVTFFPSPPSPHSGRDIDQAEAGRSGRCLCDCGPRCTILGYPVSNNQGDDDNAAPQAPAPAPAPSNRPRPPSQRPHPSPAQPGSSPPVQQPYLPNAPAPPQGPAREPGTRGEDRRTQGSSTGRSSRPSSRTREQVPPPTPTDAQGPMASGSPGQQPGVDTGGRPQGSPPNDVEDREQSPGSEPQAPGSVPRTMGSYVDPSPPRGGQERSVMMRPRAAGHAPGEPSGNDSDEGPAGPPAPAPPPPP